MKAYWGILRSLLTYYAVPGRMRRMQRFYGQFIRPGDLCFDIGAHVGNRFRSWSRLGARIVAVEPQPLMMRVCRLLYGRAAHITLLGQAIGKRPGQATLHISSRFPTVTTLSPDWIQAVRHDPSFSRVQWDRQLTVPVTTLDNLIDHYGRPAFCKIDIEGYELEALKGLSTALPALSFEYIPAAISVSRGCIDRLLHLGPYEFNWSPGETYQMAADQWLPAADMTTVLQNMPTEKGSGDIYARLVSLKC